ncbi:endoglucanase 11-like isoform X2 [Prosopis cineraria]|uniref:endoglucanase 11-like isoform X2 n=1 Tax=Prosopis cineraria TaxID=364024 RepID=UPI00240F3674|nr:endoglucanase 11-like isoform X2 [Prosopis cineraria]
MEANQKKEVRALKHFWYLRTWLKALLVFLSSTSFFSPASCYSFDYKQALSLSLLYFESQRSGHLPHNQRVTWRHHSGLTDGLEQGVDLVGGYYDAGDNVKFGLPMAFTITLLSWGVIEYGDLIASAGEYSHALEAIKWGTDYFIKAHTHPHVLWAQVGDGGTDHYCWQRPEDMTTSRRAYKLDADNPGSEVAGETAAAMAAASIVFRRTNPHYSHLLLQHAQQLFEFGDKYRGKYDESIGVAKGYYSSVSGYRDELLWAAIWLYKATENEEYLKYVLQNAYDFGGTTWAVAEFSWDINSSWKEKSTRVKAESFSNNTVQKQSTISARASAKTTPLTCIAPQEAYCTSASGTTCNTSQRRRCSSLYTLIISEPPARGSTATKEMSLRRRS